MSNETEFKPAYETALDSYSSMVSGAQKAPKASNSFYDQGNTAGFGGTPVAGEAEEDSEFSKGFGRSFAEIPGLVAGLGAYAADVVGAKNARDAMVKFAQDRNETVAKEYGSDSDSFSKVMEGKGSGWGFVKNASGYVTGQALQALITGGAGSAVVRSMAKGGIVAAGERLAAEKIAQGATAEAAKKATEEFFKAEMAKAGFAGFNAGAFAHNVGMEGGSIYPEAVEQAKAEGRDELTGGDLARVGAATVGAAAVDTAMDRLALGKVLKGSKGGGNYLARAAREVPVLGAENAATEYAQTGIEYAGAGKNFFTPEGQREGLDSAVVGAIGGHQAGAIAALHQDNSAQAALSPVIDRAAEPNSPLSRAAVAGNAGVLGQAAQAADPISQRVAAVEADLRSSGALETIRGFGPDTSNEFLYALNVARNPNTQPEMRQQAIDQVENVLATAKSGSGFSFVPPTQQQPSTAIVPAQQQGGALASTNLNGNFYDPNTIDGEVTRVDNMLPGPRALTGPSGQTTPQSPSPEAQQTGVTPTESAPKDAAASRQQRASELAEFAKNGFETVLREGDAFFLYNSKTKQRLTLRGPADAQMARKAIKDRIDELAHTAATSPLNDRKEPTPAQIAKQNWRKGDKMPLNGMTVIVENPEGSTRRGTSPDGTQWETTMAHHYGEFEGTEGADGDKLDVFVGPRPDTNKVYVIDQVNKDGSFDEHKVMMGFTTEESARQGYLANYEKGWTGLGAITEMSPEQFKSWAKSRESKKPAAQAKSVTQAANSQDFARFATLDEARAYISAQRRNGSSITALPYPNADGTFGVAIKGTPAYAKAEKFARDQQKAAKAAKNKSNGKPEVFTVRDGGKDVQLTKVRKEDLPKEASSNARDGERRQLTQSDVTLLQRLAEALGKQVQIFSGPVGDGFVRPEDPDTIYLNERSSINPVAVFGHELFHKIKDENPKAWNSIAKVVQANIGQDAFDRMMGYGYAQGEVLEEIVSDLGGDFMTDPKFWQEIFADIEATHGKEAKGIIAKLISYLNNLIENLLGDIKQPGFNSQSLVKDVRAVRAAYKEGLTQYLNKSVISRPAMQAQIMRDEQSAKKSRARDEDPQAQYDAVVAKYKDTPEWLKAPNGSDTNLTERQWVQVRTPAFKKWFGDWEKYAKMTGGVWNDDKGAVSKAVDNNGEPLVVYHGSSKGGFTEFKTPSGEKRGDLGIFTTPNLEMAKSYISRRGDEIDLKTKSAPAQVQDLLDAGFDIFETDDGKFELYSSSGNHDGTFDTRAEAEKQLLEDYADQELRDEDVPGYYPMFINLRDVVETDFEGAHWNGERNQQWIVEVGGEQQYDHNGKGYFTEEEAKEFGAEFLSPEQQEEGLDGLEYARPADDHYETTDSVVASAHRDDIDGAIIRNVVDSGSGVYTNYIDEPSDVYVALKPEQLKSATQNTGAFGDNGDLRFSRPRDIEIAKADAYEKAHGIRPYVSMGSLSIPVNIQKSIKRTHTPANLKKGYGYHPIFGLPVNANGTITLYVPTTNAEARRIASERTLKAPAGSNRVYLTNESEAQKVAAKPANISSKGDEIQASVLIQVDPSLLHIDTEHEDGRVDFFIPVAEGAAFNKKMSQFKMFNLFAERTSPITRERTFSQIKRSINDAIKDIDSMSESERKKAVARAKKVLRDEHNIGTLLSENGKLQKTRAGEYELEHYEGDSVASLGLGLASAQQITDGRNSCPDSANCAQLCLGDTSGQNLLYGGEGPYRAGPRLSQYLKTEAMVLHPEEFALVLHNEIKLFQNWALKDSGFETVKDDVTNEKVKVPKQVYQPAIRLNVTSDFNPDTWEALIDDFPKVQFYDYTKLNARPLKPKDGHEPNHHLTYSSDGVGQVVDGVSIHAERYNWKDRMKRMLVDKMNVAMAFSDKNTMPKFVIDGATGTRFQVWNGDNYDARFLDPKPGQQGNLFDQGMIIGLTNKDRTKSGLAIMLERDGPVTASKREWTDLVNNITSDEAFLNDKSVPYVLAWIKSQSGHISRKELVAFADHPAVKHNGFFVDYDPKRDGDTVVIQDQDAVASGEKVIPIKAAKFSRGRTAQTETPEFKKWFGDSKVVDKDGKPLVVYHGTDEDFTEFKISEYGTYGAGIYATNDPNVASHFGEEGHVMPVYMSIQNPYVMDLDKIKDFGEKLASRAPFRNKGARERLIAQGYDGVILREEGYEEIVAFHPEQVKSAIGNDGGFDPTNPDISKSRKRDISDRFPDTPEFKRWSRGADTVALGEFHDFRSGEPVVVEALHGTTNADLTEFKRSRANVESDWGAGFYASNTPEDVATNYANVDGPDLTQRVERLAEQLEQNDEFEGDMDAAREEARKRLSQGAPNTLKLYMRFDNPVVVGGGNETHLDYNEEYDEETDSYDEPTGKLVDFVEALRDIAPDYGVSDREIESAVDKIFEESAGEGMNVSDVSSIVKRELLDAYNDDGDSASPEIMRRALQDIGFDGVIDTTVSEKFGPKMIRNGYTYDRVGGMKGMTEDTVHFIAFEPNQIKSATGNNGEYSESRDITKSVDRKGMSWSELSPNMKRVLKEIPVRENHTSTPLEALGLSDKSYNQLVSIGIPDVETLIDLGVRGRRGLLGIGKQRLKEIEPAIEKYELDFASGTAQFSRTRKPEFFSQLERSIADLPERLSTMAAPAWKQWLKGNAPKLGIKAEEIEWSGINDYLDLQGKNKVTKADLVKYLGTSGVQVRTNIITGPQIELDPEIVEEDNGAFRLYAEDGALADKTYYDTEEEAQEALNALLADSTKYGEYTLDGGINYREVLITVPPKLTEAEERRMMKLEADRRRYKYEYIFDDSAEGRELQALQAKKGEKTYQSRHWKDQNVVAHIRVNDRVDADGKRILFVEEVQSDWGQEGKKKGFKSEFESEEALLKKRDDLYDARTELVKQALAIEKTGELAPQELIDRIHAMNDELRLVEERKDKGRNALPDAPFVTKTEGWLNLALKRIAMLAVEGGYDKVAFVNGTQSAERYDLSKQVEAIRANLNADGSYQLGIKQHGRNMQRYDTAVPADKLDEVVGKELADKIKSTVTETGVDGGKVFDGLDLKVGGKGMITFYDQIVPQTLNKLLPKLGGEKLGTVEFSHDPNPELDKWEPEDGEGDGSTVPVEVFNQPSFDVTDKMRETVGAGVPMFSRSRTPWFDDVQKLKLINGYELGDLFNSPNKMSWWQKSIGTMYNTAKAHPQFKRVYDAVQSFINDVSTYATRSADKAPTILPKLENWKDIWKSPLSADDVKALAEPIFGGTLSYSRDANGELQPEGDVDQAGVVFTDDELRDYFQLDDRQIGLYREFRAAVDQSIGDLAVSDVLRYLGEDGEGVRQRAMDATSMGMAQREIMAHLDLLIQQNPDRAEVLENSKAAVEEKFGQAERLMDRGYAPLSRYGEYTVYVVGQNGEQLYFSMFETKRDANKMAREMREQYPDAEVTTGTMSAESYKLFSGITPETLALFGESMGLEESGVDPKSAAFQQYLKLAKSNRSAMKRLIHRKGIEGYSEDAGRVLAGFVYSNARQVSTNLHAGNISKSVADVKDGDVKDAAIRLMDYIQNPREEAQGIRGLLFAQFIGGSLASAMVNMTQPFTMTMPYLSQFAGIGGAGKHMKDAMGQVINGIKGDDELAEALKRAEDEGVVSPQEVHQLMAQAQGKGALQSGDGTKVGDALAKANNTLAKISLGWGKMFSAAEQFNRRITFIAAYKIAREKGMADPFAFAEETIGETQGIYNKGNKPEWARGAIGATLFTFKQYSISYLEFIKRMYGNGPEGKRAVALALATLFVMSGFGGMPFADDLDDLIDGIMQRLFNRSFDSKAAKKEFFAKWLGKGGADFVMGGISSLPGSPIDVSGRLGLGNLIPGTGILTKKTSYTRDVMEIAGPAGSMVSNWAVAFGELAQGEVGKAAKTVSPQAAQNLIKAADMYTMGQYRDEKGRKVIDVNAWEAIAKGVGFQPASVKAVQEATSTQQNLIGQNKIREAEIADLWTAGRVEKDQSKIERAKAELAQWNKDNPDSPIKIDASQINKRVQQANMSKAQRIAKTAPKEIRGAVKKELAPLDQ